MLAKRLVSEYDIFVGRTRSFPHLIYISILMPGLSIHVVDVSRGAVATGLRVEVFHAETNSRLLIADGAINAQGLLADPRLATTLEPGYYEAVFHVAEFYSDLNASPSATLSSGTPAVSFLDVVTYRFGIHDSTQHFHLPFKMTAWGYSCFRGGA
jgi:5-hydroxyisourate hydrolase